VSDQAITVLEETGFIKENMSFLSSYAMLSGTHDGFSSVEELYPRARSGLHLHPSSVPYFCYQHKHINSYLLDFYKNRDSVGLEKFNRIRKTDMYNLLEEFSKIVCSVIAVLEELENMRKDPGRFKEQHLNDDLRRVLRLLPDTSDGARESTARKSFLEVLRNIREPFVRGAQNKK
jgi:hypothetical protein